MSGGGPEFCIEALVTDGISRMTVRGEIDALSAPDLGYCLGEAAGAGYKEIVLDLSGIEFIDSSGLTVLVTAHKRLGSAGIRLIISSVPKSTRRVFDISGLDQVLTIR